MRSLQSFERNAVYLDHKSLINESYNANAKTTSTYHLKSNLFNFKPRPLTSTKKTSANTRKRKTDSVFLSEETLDLRNVCNGLIEKLKQADVFKTLPASIDNPIDRIWEEPTEFPQLKGANNTDQFQKFVLNNNEYLIPPNCLFFNYDLLKVNDITSSLDRYDFLVLDPPWRNKYIRRIKKAKQELGYQMLHNDILSDIPLDTLIHCGSIVAVWCTNSQKHQRKLLEEFFPRWDLSLLNKITWLKLNTEGNLIGEINEDDRKQPYEVLFIAYHKDNKKDLTNVKQLELLLSIPSIIHSHKPPLLDLFRDVLPHNPKCLELFARYLQPGFTSIGLEVLKLMDVRYYSQIDNRS